jgi:hypothetical protein
MTPRLTIAVLTLVLSAGTITACERTTPGTVAMTTEAGPSTRISPPSRTSTRPTSPRTRTSTPDTPPGTSPGDPMDVTCAEYLDLDTADRLAVVQGILDTRGLGDEPEGVNLFKELADAVCSVTPDFRVSEILGG